MMPALLMFRRVAHALRYAVREEDFVTVFGAGVSPVLIGTVSYAFGRGVERRRRALLRGRDADDDERC
jgi:hypothetical protein